jgi:hypothetical protein
VDWIEVAQHMDQWRTLVTAVKNLPVPENVGKLLSSCTTRGFSKRAHLHGVSFVTRYVESHPFYSSACHQSPSILSSNRHSFLINCSFGVLFISVIQFILIMNHKYRIFFGNISAGLQDNRTSYLCSQQFYLYCYSFLLPNFSV